MIKKAMVDIPHGLTEGEELVVLRKSDYIALRRQIEEFKDVVGKIRRGEKELKNGKAKVVRSLRELR